jgi:hypothetical protein
MSPASNQTTWRRSLPELAVAALGLLVVIGLWLHNRSDSSDDGARATPTTEATTTTVPEGGSAPQIQDEARSIEGDATAARSRKDAVLRAGDLGSGWSPTGVSTGRSPLCDQKDPVSGNPTAVVRSGFRRNPGTRLVAGTVAEYPTPDSARQLLQQVADDAKACSTATVTFAVEPLAGVGEQGVRIASTVTVAGSKIRGLALIARKGARVAIVTATGDPVDDDLTLRALKAEVARL